MTHQVRHDDGVHDGGTVLSAQRELQPPRRLTAARVEAVTFQQQVLQLKLRVDAALNLNTNRPRLVLIWYFICLAINWTKSYLKLK